MSIVQPKKALVDLQQILKLEPSNRQILLQAQETQKLIRKLAFAEAIRVDDGPSVADSIEDQLKSGSAGTLVSKDYKGPHLPAGSEGQEHLGSITEDFINEMIEFFKKEGRLPVKYVWQILLGANRAFLAEDSLVEHTVEEDATIDGE